MRTDIAAQLDTEMLPPNFAFVRGVGRHFTEVKVFIYFFTFKENLLHRQFVVCNIVTVHQLSSKYIVCTTIATQGKQSVP